MQSLKRKKNIEKQLTVLEGQKYTVEEQLLTLESAESTASIYETLSMASAMQKEILSQPDYDFSELVGEVSQQKSEIEIMNQQFGEMGLESQDDLLKELEEMTKASEKGTTAHSERDEQEKLDAIELDRKLAEWELENK